MYNAYHIEKINGNEPKSTSGTSCSSFFYKTIIEGHFSIAKYTKNYNDYGTNRTYHYVLNDGSSLYSGYNFTASSGSYSAVSFFYDINGDKKPNTLGKDRFVMVFSCPFTYEYEIYADKYFLLMTPERGKWTLSTKKSTALSNCKAGQTTSTSQQYFAGCFYLIKQNGFKIPDNYPYTI